ncbi:hypothetical protein ACF0H5_001648 [Mactra antiquata]
MATVQDRYIAAMVLSGVGDALGYKNGNWEFCNSGKEIHDELKSLGGVDKLKVNVKNFMVSDDTVMHIATAKALIEWKAEDLSSELGEKLYLKMAEQYKESMRNMAGRAPGATCMNSCHMLKPSRSGGYIIDFNPRGGGCGAAMRAMCIGLFYPRPEELNKLIAVSIESGRMTHHHPTGYLGALAAALFTSYSLQRKEIKEWGCGLMETLPKALDYVKKSNIAVEENVEAWGYFTKRWSEYLKLRRIEDGKQRPVFPEKFGVKERDEFYKSCSYSGWGGSSGHDAPMIAYDALLSFNGTWPDLCSRAMFHSGDSDSTGVIAACCYGAMYGYQGVNENNYKKLEYREVLEKLAKELYQISHPEDKETVTKEMQEGDKKVLQRMDSLPPPPSEDVVADIPINSDSAKEVEKRLSNMDKI